MLSSAPTRFWAKVDKTPGFGPNGDCWRWTGAKDEHGYGAFYLSEGAGRQLAHRMAWFLTYGRWPSPCGLHRCDNPSCVRPEHVFEGTKADNIRDAIAKGRMNPTAIGALQRNKEECKNGHFFDEFNTYYTKNGTRQCKACAKNNAESYRRAAGIKPRYTFKRSRYSHRRAFRGIEGTPGA